MYLTTHPIPDAHPVDTGWVDRALSAAGDPLGALVGCPLGSGDGIMIAGWPDPAAGRFQLIDARPGGGTAPARYMQVTAFDGPRSAQWAAAEQFASTRRLWPAVRDVAGIVWALRLRAPDNAVTVVSLAETADALHEAIRAIMSTQLLPEEDPALLTRPDRVGMYRLMHADLPIRESPPG
ncbi:hypothetical protein [Dactylosporangium sp. CA-139066]|uniref:hypothetical protein n=1 Tax=Dactylosporangium sp. CA-139066 TaxID=3239930 RepID=UPI003D9294EC